MVRMRYRAPKAGALACSFLCSLVSSSPNRSRGSEGPADPSQESTTTSLGTALGTSKSMKTVRVPSEATPGKRDIVFDFISHNPKVARSNRAPATN